MTVAITTLSTMDRLEPAPPGSDNPFGSDFATVIADMASAEEWGPLRLLARHLHKLPLSEHTLERILAQLLGVCSQADDADGVRLVMAMVPTPPTWDTLAFNLACVSARQSDRAAALRFTRRALELGKPPLQFREDGDFAGLLGDADFTALLNEFGG